MHVRETTSAPLYRELADDLRDKILTGVYPRTSKLPSEAELMQDTGFSRSTVRRALATLADEHLIVTERGRGAFVADTPHFDETSHFFGSFTAQSAAQGGELTTRTVDSALVPANVLPELPEFFCTAPQSNLVMLTRLRYLDGTPLCIETAYLPETFSGLLEADLDGSLYQVLREQFGRMPAGGRKEFEVYTASQRDAFLLDVERGAALMLVTDFVYDTDGQPLHVSQRIMRTDNAKYVEQIG